MIEPREKWTGERLDESFGELRGEMNERFDKVDKRFESLDRRLFNAAVAIVVTLIGCCASLVGVAVL
ncbi:MAG TPA: hypothetical protein VFN18_12525 [Solirubrobacterales bacterium]|nr:hypothetical protein [Solirubrobacterales bacterium]